MRHAKPLSERTGALKSLQIGTVLPGVVIVSMPIPAIKAEFMPPILDIKDLRKTYADGHQALKGINLQIEAGEILALLGPNGAGKTTLISTVCGITQASSGHVTVGGYDTLREFRAARSMIGLVPQEIHLEPFERVINTVRFSRGLFGKPRDEARIEQILRQLSLWDKRDSQIRALSGGMKRRVLIAKALSHEPQLLFLDEPTAGVDVELRKDMWNIVAGLKASGVTIVLTTHYIEEAEAIADRVGVIAKGELLLVEEKHRLMDRMGRKQLDVHLTKPLADIPVSLAPYNLTLGSDGQTLTYTYDTRARTGITKLLSDVSAAGLVLSDVVTRQSSLEDIFVDLVTSEKEGSA
jgi:ABC-2 type transport system ATP-binding protein